VGGFSNHFDREGLNQRHAAIGYEKRNIELVFYHNSYHENSVAFSASEYFFKRDKFKAGFKFGTVSGYEGYEKTYGGLMPLFQFVASESNGNISVDFCLSYVSAVIIKINLGEDNG